MNTAPASGSSRLGKVLIVDDELQTLRGVVAELKSRGVAVDQAKSVAEAADLLGKKSYRLVITDAVLPHDKSSDRSRAGASVFAGFDILKSGDGKGASGMLVSVLTDDTLLRAGRDKKWQYFPKIKLARRRREFVDRVLSVLK